MSFIAFNTENPTVLNRVGKNKNCLFEYKIHLSHKEVHFQRYVLTIMGVLGNVGGILQVMTILICYFVDPISEHTYNLKAISSFYLIKSKQYA